ncbi:MAG: sensor histidine kinase [Chitinivibrionales bacterium]|nr:sensor histidine kinase [Chitinivibrionales bacterium]
MKKTGAIALMIIGISLFHYFTPVRLHYLHAIFQRLYYIPIILSAYWFGFKWGLVTAVSTGIAYAPHIFLHWSMVPASMIGKYIEIGMFALIASLVGILADVQKLQQEKIHTAQEQIRRMDRLSLLGQLAAGLAHEIRNPLGSLIGSGEILADSLGKDHPKYEFVEIMHKEHHRLRDKLNEFLKFARPSAPQIIANQLNDVVRSTLSLAQRQAVKAGCDIQPDLDETLPPLPLDAVHMQQILLNLVINGCQSMPQGGKLIVRTRKAGDSAELTVIDHGPGIPEDRQDRIFEPFYTTKDEGTGLGLAIVKQLVDGMNGSITFTSSENGTSFTIRIGNEQG